MANEDTFAAETLVHRLMLQSANDARHISDSLLESLANQLADREAELAAIRSAIVAMFAGPRVSVDGRARAFPGHPARVHPVHRRAAPGPPGGDRMSRFIDDPMDDAALSVILDAVNSREPTGLTVHVGCAQAYLEGRTLHGDVCDPCFAELDWVAADDGYKRRCDQ